MKTKYIQILTILLLISICFKAEAQSPKVLLADYTMTQFSSLKNDSIPNAPNAMVEAFRKFSKETGGHYQLLYAISKKTYIFKLKDNFLSDMDGASLQFNALSNLKFSILFQSKTYIKDDILNSNVIYCSVNPDSMKQFWTITNEQKKISGLNCTKAVFDFDGYRAIAWFSDEIPVLFSPDLYVGLPGLVVQLEDPERTFILDNLQYSETEKEFESEYLKAITEINKIKPGRMKSTQAIIENRKKIKMSK